MTRRLQDSTRQADRHIDRAEARVADLSHELHQAEQRAKQVRQASFNRSSALRISYGKHWQASSLHFMTVQDEQESLLTCKLESKCRPSVITCLLYVT